MRQVLSQLGLFGLVRIDADSSLRDRSFELDLTIDEGEKRVIVADSHVLATVELRATLSNEDRASLHDLATVSLDSQALSTGIATVA